MCNCLLWDDRLSAGEGQTTCGIYIIADTERNETQWFSSQPTSWSLGDMLILPCFIFFQNITTHETPQFLKIPDSLLSQALCKCCFLYPEFSAPNLYPSFSGDPSFTLQMMLASLFFFWLFTYSTIIHKFYEGLPITISPGPSILWFLN